MKFWPIPSSRIDSDVQTIQFGNINVYNSWHFQNNWLSRNHKLPLNYHDIGVVLTPIILTEMCEQNIAHSGTTAPKAQRLHLVNIQCCKQRHFVCIGSAFTENKKSLELTIGT